MTSATIVSSVADIRWHWLFISILQRPYITTLQFVCPLIFSLNLTVTVPFVVLHSYTETFCSLVIPMINCAVCLADLRSFILGQWSDCRSPFWNVGTWRYHSRRFTIDTSWAGCSRPSLCSSPLELIGTSYGGCARSLTMVLFGLAFILRQVGGLEQ